MPNVNISDEERMKQIRTGMDEGGSTNSDVAIPH